MGFVKQQTSKEIKNLLSTEHFPSSLHIKLPLVAPRTSDNCYRIAIFDDYGHLDPLFSHKKPPMSPHQQPVMSWAPISRSCCSSSHLDLRNILNVRPPPISKKNKLLLNEYLGNFRHFWSIFFLWKMTFSNPPTPLKCRKFRTFFF